MADLPFSSRRNPAKQGIAFSPILSFHDFLDYLPRKQLFKMTARVLYFGAVITLALIVLDHRGMIEKDAFYFYSQVLLILLLVISTSLLFQHLMKILTDRGQRIQLLNETKDLNDRLACAVDYQDVYRQVLQFAAKIFPGAETALYIHDEDYNQLTLAANSSPENQQPITRQTACLACLRQGDHGAHPFAVCRQEALLQSPLAPRPFCLALRDNARIIGMLYLKAPTGESLAREQIDLFETVDNELARALAAAQEKKKRTEMALAQAIMAARMEIARDLHDTLGQNIAYLRMTLENLDEMGSNVRANTGGDIRQMYTVANESYDLLRSTLSILQVVESSSASLQNLFSTHAHEISKRCGIVIDVSVHGTPEVLPVKTLRQLFYIFREALNNIEKHAGASQVDVDLLWERASLTMTITDNGEGFDPAAVPDGKHFGLKFMRSRVNDLYGQFFLRSALGAGTSLTVCLPIREEPRRIEGAVYETDDC